MKTLFNVGNFRFEKVEVNKWLDTGARNLEYHLDIKKIGITKINRNEGILTFESNLEISPIGEIKFQGECILFSNILDPLIEILNAKKGSEMREKNKHFIEALNKYLRKRCLEYSKEVGEKEGIEFINYDLVIRELRLEHISFKDEVKPVLTPEGNQLIPKKTENHPICKDFLYFNEKVIPEINSGKKMNAFFEVDAHLNNLKILSLKRLLVQFHFTLKVSPKVALIEFDGQFIMETTNRKVGDLVRHQKEKLKKNFQIVIAKAGIKHAQKIGKKYRVGFSSEKVLRELGLAN